MRMNVHAIWWLTCILWSSVWLFIKIGVSGVPPLGFAGLRLALALLVLLPFFARELRRGTPSRSEWALIGASGFLLLGLNYAFVFWGAQFIPSGIIAILQAASPAFGIAFTRLAGGPLPRAAQVAGLAVGVAGVALISANQLGISGRPALLGSAAVAAGSACVAAAYTIMKARLTHLPPVVTLVGQMVAGGAPLLVAGLLLEGNPLTFNWSPRTVAALVYLAGAGSIAAFWLNLWLLKRTDAFTILAMSIVEPLLAVALGWLVLKEHLTVTAGVGSGLILVSVWMVLARRT